jgi:hypothetical protein
MRWWQGRSGAPGAVVIHAPGERWSYCNAGYVVLSRRVQAGRTTEPVGVSSMT